MVLIAVPSKHGVPTTDANGTLVALWGTYTTWCNSRYKCDNSWINISMRILASCVAGTLMVVPLHVLNVDPIPNPTYVVITL